MSLPYVPSVTVPQQEAPTQSFQPQPPQQFQPQPAYYPSAQAIPYMAPVLSQNPGYAEPSYAPQKESLGTRFMRFQIEHPILSKIAMFIALIVGFIIFFLLTKWILCDVLGQQWVCDIISGIQKILSWVWTALKKVLGTVF